MKAKTIVPTAILLIISVVGCFTIISQDDIRSVEFISILVIGVLLGVLLAQLFGSPKARKIDKEI